MTDQPQPNDDEPADPLPAFRAYMDQVLAMAPELARSARTWHQAFQSEGFSPQESLYLTACQILQRPGPPPI